MHLLRITAPHFCAGIVIENMVCVRAAPILRWTEGKTQQEVVRYFNRKGYAVMEVRRRRWQDIVKNRPRS